MKKSTRAVRMKPSKDEPIDLTYWWITKVDKEVDTMKDAVTTAVEKVVERRIDKLRALALVAATEAMKVASEKGVSVWLGPSGALRVDIELGNPTASFDTSLETLVTDVIEMWDKEPPYDDPIKLLRDHLRAQADRIDAALKAAAGAET